MITRDIAVGKYISIWLLPGLVVFVLFCAPISFAFGDIASLDDVRRDIRVHYNDTYNNPNNPLSWYGEPNIFFMGVINPNISNTTAHILLAYEGCFDIEILRGCAPAEMRDTIFTLYYIDDYNYNEYLSGAYSLDDVINISAHTNNIYTLWKDALGKVALCDIPDLSSGVYYILILYKAGPDILRAVNDPGNEHSLSQKEKFFVKVSNDRYNSPIKKQSNSASNEYNGNQYLTAYAYVVSLFLIMAVIIMAHFLRSSKR